MVIPPMRYAHTQRSPLWVVLLIVAAGMAGLGVWMLHTKVPTPPVIIVWAAAALVAATALCFQQLTVSDEVDHLLLTFGPLPLFRKRIAYRNIRSVTPGRSRVLDGWGIHWRPGGWIWNIWGFSVVELKLKNITLRVGTDDVEGLTATIRARLAELDAGQNR